MLKITFTVERRKPRPQQPGQELQRHGRRQRQLGLLPVLAFVYCATLITSLVTGDNSMLTDVNRELVQFVARLFGLDLGT